MKTGLSLIMVAAGLAIVADDAAAGWFSGGEHSAGRHHHAHFNSRFLQRPCPPYHGWNRPFYGWSSNYRPYYFTPQPYANTPWAYGPYRHAEIYQTAAPTPGLNSYGVPVQSSSTDARPTLAPQNPPSAVPGSSSTEPTPASPIPVPGIPEPPQPSP